MSPRGVSTDAALHRLVVHNGRVNPILLSSAAPHSALRHEIVVKRSRFLAAVARVPDAAAARAFIDAERAATPDARHHCTAFLVSVPGAAPQSHSSDDGEPSGTAGRPMLDVLTGSGVTDIVAVVTRYFGGTLLGTGGLVRAYSDAVRECLEGARLVERQQVPVWQAFLPHAYAGRYIAKVFDAGETVEPEYLEDGVRVSVMTDDGERLRAELAQLSGGAITLEQEGSAVVERSWGHIRSGKAVNDWIRSGKAVNDAIND
ncbi:MAG: YigZ family protein [Actinomycetaceae bacterium]|nr:YigZ family protein [Actinomycetaceae bacterium]